MVILDWITFCTTVDFCVQEAGFWGENASAEAVVASNIANPFIIMVVLSLEVVLLQHRKGLPNINSCPVGGKS